MLNNGEGALVCKGCGKKVSSIVDYPDDLKDILSPEATLEFAKAHMKLGMPIEDLKIQKSLCFWLVDHADLLASLQKRLIKAKILIDECLP